MPETVADVSEKLTKRLDKVDSDISVLLKDLNFIKGIASVIVVLVTVIGAFVVNKFFGVAEKVVVLEATTVRVEQLAKIETAIARLEGLIQQRPVQRVAQGGNFIADCDVRRGTVVSVDQAKIVIETPPPRRRELAYTIDKTTKIFVRDKRAKVADLKVGMTVTIAEDEQGVAKQINEETAVVEEAVAKDKMKFEEGDDKEDSAARLPIGPTTPQIP